VCVEDRIRRGKARLIEHNLRGDERQSFLPGLEALEVAPDPDGPHLSFLPRHVHPWDVSMMYVVVNLGVFDKAGLEWSVHPLEIPQGDGVSARALGYCFQVLDLPSGTLIKPQF